MKSDSTPKLLFAALAITIAILIILFASGCEVLKSKRQSYSDTASVKKTELVVKDSSAAGNVKITDEKRKEDYEWFRLILQNWPKDSSVTNIYPQPATIIYEGGKGRSETAMIRRDSAWDNKLTLLVANTLDSMNRRMEMIEKKKQSETKGVGLVTLLIVGAIFLLVNRLLAFAGSNYKIQKVKS